MACRKRGGQHQPKGGNWINKSIRLAIYLRDGFACIYCGKDMRAENPVNVTLDHLISRSENNGEELIIRRGISHLIDSPYNLVTACRPCNSSRQDKPWRDFAPGGAIIRIERNRRRKLIRYLRMAKALIAGQAKNLSVENR